MATANSGAYAWRARARQSECGRARQATSAALPALACAAAAEADFNLFVTPRTIPPIPICRAYYVAVCNDIQPRTSACNATQSQGVTPVIYTSGPVSTVLRSRVYILFRPVNTLLTLFLRSVRSFFFALCPFSLQAPAFQICVNPALCGTACFRLGDTAANGVLTSFPWNAAHGVRLQYTGGDLCEDASLPQQTPR